MLLSFAAVAFLSLQPSPQASIDSLVGHWETTVKPPAGEAPAIQPSFDIAKAADGKLTLVLQGSTEQLAATALIMTPKDEMLLLSHGPTSRGQRIIIVRPTGPNEARFELYMDVGAVGRNYYYAEIFKRVKK